jgi:hypothetical protein
MIMPSFMEALKLVDHNFYYSKKNKICSVNGPFVLCQKSKGNSLTTFLEGFT